MHVFFPTFVLKVITEYKNNLHGHFFYWMATRGRKECFGVIWFRRWRVQGKYGELDHWHSCLLESTHCMLFYRETLVWTQLRLIPVPPEELCADGKICKVLRTILANNHHDHLFTEYALNLFDRPIQFNLQSIGKLSNHTIVTSDEHLAVHIAHMIASQFPRLWDKKHWYLIWDLQHHLKCDQWKLSPLLLCIHEISLTI